jgi:RNA polymerase sigma factor (sigma-70 family)
MYQAAAIPNRLSLTARSGAGALVRRRSLAFDGPMLDAPAVAGPEDPVPDHRSPAGPSLNDLVLAVARDRDRGAFAALFQHFAPRLKAWLMRLGADAAQADELAQEVMLTVWRRADSFDPAQAGAGTWIFTIARNRRIDRIRREKHPEIDANDPALVPEAPESADRRIESLQNTARLRAAIEKLPVEQAELLRLAYFEDRPHSAIAEQQQLPLGTVKSRLRLALARLRRELSEES